MQVFTFISLAWLPSNLSHHSLLVNAFSCSQSCD